MRTLLIDNYDSYTYNLFQLIAEVNGELPLVHYNDQITLEQISSMVQAGTVHSIVISPGPGTPNNSNDIGVCLDVLQQLPDVPILGICLGHQALALAHGASVVTAPEPVHGRLSRLRHSGHGLFKDIPSGHGFEVVRYHSLLVDERSLPDCLEPVCWTTGGHVAVKLARDAPPTPAGAAAAAAAAVGPSASALDQSALPHQQWQQQQQEPDPEQPQLGPGGGCLLMGLAHRSRPHYGVQFHPESVATRYGIALLRNFRDLAAAHIRRTAGPAAALLPPARPVADIVGPPGRLPGLPSWPSPEHQRGATLRLLWSRLGGLLTRLPGGSQAVFELLYGWAEDTFWLDSAAADRGRFSYMGGRGGPLWRKLTYKIPAPEAADAPHPSRPQAGSQPQPPTDQQSQQQPPVWVPTANGCISGDEANIRGQQQQMPLDPSAVDADSDSASSSSTAAGSASSCGAGSNAGASSSCATTSTTAAAAAAGGCGPHAGVASSRAAAGGGTLTVETPDGRVGRVVAPDGFLGYLQCLLAQRRLRVETEAAEALPFNFWGGLVGYLGYELKAECGGVNAHAASTPDAVMYLADRLVAADHATGDVYLLALYDSAAGGDGDGDRTYGEGHSGGGGAEWVGRAGPAPGRRGRWGGEGAEEAACVSPGCKAQGAEGEGLVAAADTVEQEAQAQTWLRATQRALEAAAEAAGPEAGSRCAGPPVAADAAPSSSPHAPAPACSPTSRDSSRAAPPPAAEMEACGTSCSACSTQQQPGRAGPDGPRCPAADASASATVAATAAATQAEAMVPFTLAHGRAAYLRNIAACHAALHAGESYEVCLTTALTRPAAPSPPQLYRTLRQLNPAPYAAWLQCGAAGPTICCSSPERFLRGDRGGLLEARPIKGTAARVAADPAADAAAAAELARSEKERAENLMIVDLLRNDLGRVCEVGTVHVPGLMDIESYATVHQMVSTVRGVRRAGLSIIDCIRAAFPGGSMTGAPKVRTMAIIDSLEGRARGVYSGSIGFMSLNDTFDLNIVIRTAVIEDAAPEAPAPSAATAAAPGAAASSAAGAQHVEAQAQPAERRRTMTIGAGGAIVVQSQPEAEYEEMRLKARALLRAVGLCEGGDGPVPVVSN